MKTIFLLYIISQLISTAYGLAVIESLNPIIKNQLTDKGYIEKNKNSLYNYNDRISNILKGFIPFYYAIKAVNLIKTPNPIDNEVNRMIKSGRYISKEDLLLKENKEKNEHIISEPEIVFEKPEKYVARKNDNSLYDTYITPVEYVINEVSKEELQLTPFEDPNRIVEHVMIKSEVTTEDIAKAISQLDADELGALNTTIANLKEIKNQNKVLELKDVA